MKKIIVASVLAVSLCCVPAMASGDIDLTTMSLEELKELQTELTKEIINKGGYEVFPAGAYVAGTDIEAGSYTLISDDELSANVRIFDSKAMYTLSASTEEAKPTFEMMIVDGETATANLSDGQVLVTDDSLYITKSAGSWAVSNDEESVTE